MSVKSLGNGLKNELRPATTQSPLAVDILIPAWLVSNMDTSTQKMSGDQKTAAFTISGVSLLIVIARHIWPDKIILDQATMLLLALAALPWLTLFFKKFRIPGLGEAETQDRAQGATQNPLPPADVQPRVAAAAPSADALKVLATLWRYQRQAFGSDLTKRWTFTVHPSAREYPRFLAGLSETVNRGWVAVSPETRQCMLTNEGLAYVESNPSVREHADIYRF